MTKNQPPPDRKRSPDRQPRRPAPSNCRNCNGAGTITFEGQQITCGVCGGSGKI